MKKPYVLDVDGLDGISELTDSNVEELSNETESKLVQPNAIETVVKTQDIPDKKTSSVLPTVVLLIIGLIGLVSYIFLFNQDDNESLPSRVASTTDQEKLNPITDKPSKISASKPNNTNRVIAYNKNANATAEMENKSAFTTDVIPKLSIPASVPIDKPDLVRIGNTKAGLNAKIKAQRMRESQNKRNSQSESTSEERIASLLSASEVKNRGGKIKDQRLGNTKSQPDLSLAAVEPVKKRKRNSLNAERTKHRVHKQVKSQNTIDKQPKPKSQSAPTNDKSIVSQRSVPANKNRDGKINDKRLDNTKSQPYIPLAVIKPAKKINSQNGDNSSVETNVQVKADIKPEVLKSSQKAAGIVSNEFILPFDFNETTVDNLSNEKLLALKDFSKSCSGMIRVVGYTCNLGPALSNQAVGRIRADWVKGLLVEQGVSAGRIKTASAGQTNPVASNKTYAGRLLNRRVVVGCTSSADKL